MTVRRAIRSGTIEGKLVPVLCGSALKNKGVQPLLDAIVRYLHQNDIVLNEILGAAFHITRGIEVTPDDIVAMGVGGLLTEIPIRPHPREKSNPVDR